MMDITNWRGALVAASLMMAGATASATDVLFDPSLGTLPSTQGSLLFCSGGLSAFCAGPDGTQTVVAAGVELDSTTIPSPNENDGQVGYSNFPPAPGPFDRTTGFTLNFDLQVNFESHSSSDRAGFSVIVISDDRKGIEIGFWEDEIWAQNWAQGPGFTKAERVAFDTNDKLVNYSLGILGDAYTLSALSAAGTPLPLLTGMLRDYWNSGIAPYTVANFLFFGDDTTSARAVVTLGAISVSAVPLPASIMLLIPALAGLLGRRRA